MATAQETAQRHANDVVAGNMAGVVADFTPEALAEFQQHGVMPPRPTTKAEIVSHAQEGNRERFEIAYSNDSQSVTIRSWWEDQGGVWKLVKAEPAG
ncbi:MAG TPA: hypothetical protein VH916_14265 [Dehalococcoidia bacterium]